MSGPLIAIGLVVFWFVGIHLAIGLCLAAKHGDEELTAYHREKARLREEGRDA